MLLLYLIQDIIKSKKSDKEKLFLIEDIVGSKEYPKEFQIFWNQYLHIQKAKGGKTTIFKMYNLLCRRGIKPFSINTGLHNYIKDYRGESKYIIQPRSFLRDRIWEEHQQIKLNFKESFICEYGITHNIGEECKCF